jgi:Tol biopolymer transport system component
VYDLDGAGAARRLTFGGRDRYPIWSADSQWVIFQSDRGGDSAIYRQRADGSGAAERLTMAGKDVTQFPETAAPDGSVLLFNQAEGSLAASGGRTTLMAYSFKDRMSAPYGGITSRYQAGAEFSPDGKWLAYAVAESAQTTPMPFVEPYPATGAKYQMSTASGGGHNPMWSRDGGELFYTLGPATTMVAIKVKTSPTFSFAPPETVARPFTNSPPVAGRAFDAVQGGRFLGLLPADAADPSTARREQIRVVLNWTEELKGRVR